MTNEFYEEWARELTFYEEWARELTNEFYVLKRRLHS